MPNFSPLIGINSPILGKSNSLITPSGLYRKSQIPAVQINQIALLDLPVPLIQTSKLFAKAAVDRLHHSTKQSEIGWDNWQAINQSSNHDDFDYKIDRSRSNLDYQSSQTNAVDSPELDFFTTVLPTDFTEIDPQVDFLPTHPVEVEIPTPVKQDRFARVEATQTQSLEKIQPKSIEADRKLSDSNQVNKIEQPKSLIKASQVSTNIQPPSTPQLSPKPVSESKIVSESLIAFSLDNLALNAVDNSFLEPLLETSTDLNLNSTELPAPDLTQISRSADEIVPNLASPPELIPDFIVPNPLDAPTIINPVTALQVTPLEPAITTSIISESAALSPGILAPFPVLEQIATVTEITPTPESSGRLPSDLIVSNPLDSPTIVDLQPPVSTTAQLSLLEQRSAAAENIASVRPLTVEPVREIPSLNRSESPSIENQSTTGPGQIATSDTQIKIAADLQSTQILNVDTFQFNTIDSTTINQVSSALEQISTFTDEPIPENIEIPPIPIAESINTLAAPLLSLAEPLPWRINPDLTIESIHRFPDFPRSNADRSLKENIPLEVTEVIAVAQENITKSDDKFRSDILLLSPLADRSVINQTIADSTQNNNQLEHLPVEIIDKSDRIGNPINNPINNSTHAIQLDPVTTELSVIDQEALPLISIDSLIDINDDNSTDINIPAPTVGYATGGYVKDTNHIDLQSIATSDTVSAMLTPGEFVINAKAVQKNLDLLTHINSGGEPETALLNTEIQPSIPVPTSTDISPTLIQRKRNNSLFSPSLQREINLQQLSPLINPALDTFQSNQAESSKSSPIYSSPSMIFRKPMSSAQSQYSGVDTPDEWGSIEDLINGGSHNSDVFSMNNSPQQHPDLESRSSPRISPQDASPIRGFADGGEVTPSDISTTIAPITHTIESPIANPQQQAENNDPAELEILAREIYHRLRQRLEIERERHGSYSGNLAW